MQGCRCCRSVYLYGRCTYASNYSSTLLTFVPGSPDAFVNELMKPSGANLTLDSMDLN